MRLDVLLEILRALEGLLAKVALVRLQGNVDADVRGDVVALDGRGAAVAPLALEVEVVCALAADMLVADVLLRRVSEQAGKDGEESTNVEGFWRGATVAAAEPLAGQRIDAGRLAGGVLKGDERICGLRLRSDSSRHGGRGGPQDGRV